MSKKENGIVNEYTVFPQNFRNIFSSFSYILLTKIRQMEVNSRADKKDWVYSTMDALQQPSDPSSTISLTCGCCLSVVGNAGLSDRHAQSGDEEALWRSAGWSYQQTDAAHQRQTAAPQNLFRSLEPTEKWAQQGVWLKHSRKHADTQIHFHLLTND